MDHKVLHYCWFGNADKPDIVLKCMESWEKFCPGFEIKEWNETNFDLHCCKYVEEAYLMKKWAFVSDYCRFWVLHEYGGVYLDTDVELIKPIADLPNAFVGFESPLICNSGLIRGAEGGDAVCKMMLDSYESDKFILSDGKLNLTTVCERETELLKENGLIPNGSKQCVLGTVIFPPEYFCPLNYDTHKLKITENTYSIHHYLASWSDGEKSFKGRIYKIISKVFGKKFANWCRSLYKKQTKEKLL